MTKFSRIHPKMSSLSYSSSSSSLSKPIHSFSPNPNPKFPLLYFNGPLYLRQQHSRSFSITYSRTTKHQILTSNDHNRRTTKHQILTSNDHNRKYPKLPVDLLRIFTTSAIIFFGIGIRSFSAAASTQIPPIADRELLVEQQTITDEKNAKIENAEDDEEEDEEMRAAFESWKKKTYALTVPLRVVALRNSIPPLWIKNFIQSQGKRSNLRLQYRGSLDEIFSDLSKTYTKENVTQKSVAAADVVSIGDTWLSLSIKKALVEPIQSVEEQDWFNGLSDKWKVYLRRNSEGKLDSDGKIWAAPYRWGSIVIAYKKKKFKKHNLAPIEDWGDLWRAELAGKISMVDSPREVIGAVLKYLGASYNTTHIDSQVLGGTDAVRQNLALLQKQVKVFDNTEYIKAFGVGDVWVAVGWSSEIIPMAKRMNGVSVIVPKSGASLWADLWAIPAATKLNTDKIGGRTRGPSPLVDQWFEFCLQEQRSLPFKQEVVPGASPSALNTAEILEASEELGRNKPKLDTNLIVGVPPPNILEKCEFLEPLSDDTLSEYRSLIEGMQKPRPGLVQGIGHHVKLLVKKISNKIPVLGSLK